MNLRKWRKCRHLSVVMGFALSCHLFAVHAAASADAQTSDHTHDTNSSSRPMPVTACSIAQLQGTWQLASARYLDKAGTVVGSITAGSTLSRKIVAGQHMAFITWQPDGRFEVAASGSVRLEHGMYVERIDTASKPRLIGKTYRFVCQLDGDMWQHSGDEDGIHIEEQWQRVK